jgi:hypothetical protein
VIVVLTGGEGCAIENSGLPGSDSKIIRAYGRNGVVQLPTALGNAVGVVVAEPVVLPVALVVKLAFRNSYKSEFYEYETGWIVAVPVYALGGVTGTPFLPLSLLYPERRLCLGC